MKLASYKDGSRDGQLVRIEVRDTGAAQRNARGGGAAPPQRAARPFDFPLCVEALTVGVPAGKRIVFVTPIAC